MKQPDSKILVGTVDKQVFVKVEGKGTHLVSQPLREFLFQMIDSGYCKFEIDLANCTYMDSTFLGMLVGVSLRLKKVSPAKIFVTRINERNLDLFKTLGIDSFFQIGPGATPVPASKPEDLHSLPEAKVATQAWAETMLEAHETLAKVDARNLCRFKDVIAYLKEDLAKIKASSPSSPASTEKSGS